MQDRHSSGNSTEAVTARLRHMILSGELAQGARVTELGLASLLDVSRTPVRLALATLEQEELVEGAPNRGFRVRTQSLQSVREQIEVRATLEGMAARLAAENKPTPAQEAALRRNLEEVDRLVAARPDEKSMCRAFSRINIRFHAGITEIAANSALAKLLDRSWTSPYRSAPALYLARADEVGSLIASAQRDHVRLVEAIVSGQSARAEALMREHALSPLEKLEELLERTGPPAILEDAGRPDR